MKTCTVHDEDAQGMIEHMRQKRPAMGASTIRCFVCEAGKMEEVFAEDLEELARMEIQVKYTVIQAGISDFVFIIHESNM